MSPFNKRILIPALIMLLLAPNVRPAKWEPVAISDDHSAWLFLDYSSIKRDRGKPVVRIMLEYADDQPGIAETNYLPYIAIRNLIQFNCAKRLLLPLEEEYVDSEEGFLGGSDMSGEKWRPIFPESLIESAYEIVCKRTRSNEMTQQEEATES